MTSREILSSTRMSTVYGSPGARVRFMGFFSIFWPFMLMIFAAGWLLGCVWPLPAVTPFIAGALLIVLALTVWWAFGSAGKRFEAFLKGARGEEIVARELSLLPEDWSVFHGIPRPGFDSAAGGGDFDHVVLGPNGIFLIETKNWEGPVTVDGGILRVRGKVPGRAPVAQVRRESLELAGLLRKAAPAGLPIQSVICFASNGFDSGEDRIDDVILCNARTIRDILLGMPPQRIDAAHLPLIVDTLLRNVT